MRICMVNKLTIVNNFFQHTFHRKIMRSAIKIRKTTEKNEGSFPARI